jgi:hypothetical protein
MSVRAKTTSIATDGERPALNVCNRLGAWMEQKRKNKASYVCKLHSSQVFVSIAPAITHEHQTPASSAFQHELTSTVLGVSRPQPGTEAASLL